MHDDTKISTIKTKKSSANCCLLVYNLLYSLAVLCLDCGLQLRSNSSTVSIVPVTMHATPLLDDVDNTKTDFTTTHHPSGIQLSLSSSSSRDQNNSIEQYQVNQTNSNHDGVTIMEGEESKTELQRATKVHYLFTKLLSLFLFITTAHSSAHFYFLSSPFSLFFSLISFWCSKRMKLVVVTHIC